MLHQTIEKRHALKLSAMADGVLAQSWQPGIEALGFEGRLALLVDVQHAAAHTAALGQRLKAANLRQTACLEDLDLRTPRGLDRTLVATLASGQWIRTSRSVLLTGPDRGGARPSSPAPSGTRRRVAASQCCTGACRGGWTTWRSPGWRAGTGRRSPSWRVRGGWSSMTGR